MDIGQQAAIGKGQRKGLRDQESHKVAGCLALSLVALPSVVFYVWLELLLQDGPPGSRAF